tara:strand:- start:1156 stop:1836 length:681 start_codon:yes stop_codon:yes gene_type:complete
MSRWFVIFLLSLIIVLGTRYGTYSPLPAAVFAECETPIEENNLQGLWELNRIDNYEAFHVATSSETGFLKFIEVSALPIALENSQLYRIEQCGKEIALSLNNLRSWIVATAEIEKPNIKVEPKDKKTEIKEKFENTFQEVITDVKDALQIDTTTETDKSLKFIQKSDALMLTAELTLSGEEITIYGSLNGNNYKETVFFDSGELVREITFVDSNLGSTEFVYRRYP